MFFFIKYERYMEGTKRGGARKEILQNTSMGLIYDRTMKYIIYKKQGQKLSIRT